jgi:hypothetical protein
MQDRLREQTRERFARRCAYCGVHEDDVGATLTVDHHRPRARGGADDIDNLVYACPRCNDHKGAYWHEKDPPHVPLLHPGRDDMAKHLREENGGRMIATSPAGQFFLDRLSLNRPPLVAYRRAAHDRRELHEQLENSMRRARELERRVNDLGRTIDAAADDLERNEP